MRSDGCVREVSELSVRRQCMPQFLEDTMTGIRIFNVHYLWEDCGSMVLGALIVLTAWMVGDVVASP
jgi:hypothetical protein